jgi:hypothetical protein
MKKLTPQGLVLIIALISVLYLLNKFVLNRPDSISIGGILNNKAHDLNKSLPKIIDEFTTLDKVVYIPSRQLQFNYTLNNLSVDDSTFKTMMDSMKTEIIRTIKQDAGIKLLLDSSVTFSYSYNDSLGHSINKLTIVPNDYK